MRVQFLDLVNTVTTGVLACIAFPCFSSARADISTPQETLCLLACRLRASWLGHIQTNSGDIYVSTFIHARRSVPFLVSACAWADFLR